MRVGVVGGTGLGNLMSGERLPVETPWGPVDVVFGRSGRLETAFVARHGDPARPPHRVRFRANVWALAAAKVDRVVAVNTVGALHATIPTPSFFVPHDFVDLSGRADERTFHDERAVHVDLSEPYCPEVRRALVAAASDAGLAARGHGVYVASPGPRLETPAETRWYATLGDVVGMTGCPEAALAREKGLCYASLCLVTNPAPGVAPGPVRAVDIAASAKALADAVGKALARALGEIPERKACRCGEALAAAGI
ncbi:MAG TPA: MTAP family purine nucleoside phosphorylase [Candidatus Thermoplasmatota archaeon]|nr:MTAP family purine nucleoside phosphorylase [Candidatus Thermoplasmatota archaeon]